MRRFVGAPLDEFERLFVAAAPTSLPKADYPPFCGASSGPLRFRAVRAGGMIVEVQRCDSEASGDFRLDVLFKVGSCAFGDAIDLASFWNGPVADAFGLPRGPVPERAQESLLDDLQERVSVAAPVRPASKAAQRKRPPSSVALAERLGARVCGQELALQSLASLVISQIAKRVPKRPATALLIGPPGAGKTSTAEALPEALAAEGWQGAHVHRIDCNELSDDYDVRRFLGSAPGLVGYDKAPPLVTALRKRGCIVLLDEIDKAHPAVWAAFYSLLESGRVMAPDGTAVTAPDSILIMTSSDGADDLASCLHQVVLDDRRRVDRTVRTHLRDQGWPSELVGRIDTISVFTEFDESGRRLAAAQAIRILGAEYGFSIESLPSILADVVVDIATTSELGARGLYYGARDLLGDTFTQAAIEGVGTKVFLHAGPPPTVSPAD